MTEDKYECLFVMTEEVSQSVRDGKLLYLITIDKRRVETKNFTKFDLYMKEMVWNIVNNVDLERAKSTILDERFTFIETGGIMTVTYALVSQL